MTFKVYNCDFGFVYNDTTYNFTDVDSLSIEDAEMTRLTRGANGNNKAGIVYKEGMKEPKRWTVTINNVTAEIYNLLSTIYSAKSRADIFCVDRTDGSSKWAKQSILSSKPQQLTLDETPESMNISLIFESFDTSEVHKT